MISRPLEDQLYRELIEAARRTSEHAYRPYSNFAVGAAVLTFDDRIYVGCNVENYGLTPTVHAEQVAVCSAVAEGALTRARAAGLDQFRFLRAIAVYIPECPAPWPCLGCRQFLSEFGRTMKIVGFSGKDTGTVLIKTLEELSPDIFPIESVITSVKQSRST